MKWTYSPLKLIFRELIALKMIKQVMYMLLLWNRKLKIDSIWWSITTPPKEWLTSLIKKVRKSWSNINIRQKLVKLGNIVSSCLSKMIAIKVWIIVLKLMLKWRNNQKNKNLNIIRRIKILTKWNSFLSNCRRLKMHQMKKLKKRKRSKKRRKRNQKERRIDLNMNLMLMTAVVMMNLTTARLKILKWNLQELVKREKKEVRNNKKKRKNKKMMTRKKKMNL